MNKYLVVYECVMDGEKDFNEFEAIDDVEARNKIATYHLQDSRFKINSSYKIVAVYKVSGMLEL